MCVQVAPNKDSLEPLETNSWQKELLPEPGKPQTLDFYKGVKSIRGNQMWKISYSQMANDDESIWQKVTYVQEIEVVEGLGMSVQVCFYAVCPAISGRSALLRGGAKKPRSSKCLHELHP